MGVNDASARYLVVDVDGFAADGAPSGYRRTEAGVIPSDWLVMKLSDLCEVLTGLTYRPSDVDSDGIIVLRSSNIQNGQLVLDDSVFVRSSAVPEKVMVRSGDILICVRNGSRELIGKSALIPVMNMRAAFGAFMAVLRSSESAFVHHAFKSEGMQQQVRERLGATINQITRAGFEAFVLPAPSLSAERRKIAEALSDADALIESLQQLIAKKRALKQGAMQALLTGRQRLPGFHKPWVECALADAGGFRKGRGVTRSEANSGELPCVRYGELYTVHENVIHHFESRISAEVASRATQIRKGDILFAGSGETKAEIGKCAALVDDVIAYAGGDIVVFRPGEGDARFYGYLLNADYVNDQKSARGQGDAVVHISAASLATVSVRLPSVEEQIAIATVLSNMDAEIDALEARLAKARDLKAGMMQALLTGRIRLPLDQAA